MDAAGGGADQVTDVHPQFDGILNLDIRVAHGVFLQEVSGIRIQEITLVRESGRDAAGDIAEYLRFAVDGFTGEAAANVAVDGVRDVAAGAIRNESQAGHVYFRFAKLGGGEACRISKLGYHDQFSQLLSYVAGLGYAVVFSSQGNCAQHDVADGGFAAGIAVPVEQGEEQGADCAMLRSPARNTLSQGIKHLSKMV